MKPKLKGYRFGFTLIEFLVSVAICMILMAGLYFAVDIQTRSTKVGRAVVEEAMLARSVLDLVARDIEPAVTITQPFRFRKGSLVYGSTSSSSATASSSTSSGTSGSTGSGSAATSGSSTGSSSGSATTTSNSSSSSGSSSSTGSSSGDSSESTSVYGPALIPPGVVGFPGSLNLYIRRDLRKDEQGTLSSGVFRVTYGLIPSDEEGADGQGLGRWEVKLAQTEIGLNPDANPPENEFELVAPEVKAIRFKFHAGDGGDWLEQWDSRTTGSDEVTPQGPPRAVKIEVDLQVGKEGPLQTYFRVVHIPVGNTPALPPPTTATTSTP